MTDAIVLLDRGSVLDRCPGLNGAVGALLARGAVLSETRIRRLTSSFQARVPYDRSLAIQRCDLFLRAAQDLAEDLIVMFAEKVGFKVFVLRPD